MKLNNPLNLSNKEIIDLLRFGKIEIEGQFMFGSNYTFLAIVTYKDLCCKAVYKPQRGEIPLWDFPPETLANRELAAFLISKSLGWNFVPTTIIRNEGPFGEGALQIFIPHNSSLNYFNFSNEIRSMLKQTAIFDIVINNADRKGSHILLDEAGKIWLIDHGICFHSQPKLRTVIWDFVGEDVPKLFLQDLENFSSQLERDKALIKELIALLSPLEIKALKMRVNSLLQSPTFPAPSGDSHTFPYPLV